MADDKKKTTKGSSAKSATSKGSVKTSAKSLKADARLSELTINDLSSILRSEVDRAIAERLKPGSGQTGSHVNSGPPGFVNGGGHANFDPGDFTGSHVNSGPPGFVNGGGHANFDPGSTGSHVNSGPPGFVNGGGHANFDPGDLTGSHVNSGPPGFVNGGGHANFDPADSGSHVNSGPPGFTNGGGHANFDPDSSLRPNLRTNPATMRVTLKDGTSLDIEAGLSNGGINLNIRGR